MDTEDGRKKNAHRAIDALIRTARRHHNAVETQSGDDPPHRGQHRLLMHLSRAGSAASQRRLADDLEVSPACVARMLKSLTDDGYIERTGDADDARRNTVRITPKGLEVVEDSRRRFEALDLRAFTGFTDEEIDTLGTLLLRVHANLTNKEGA